MDVHEKKIQLELVETVVLTILNATICPLTRTRTWLGCRTFRSWRSCWRKQKACPSSLGLGA